MPREPAEAARRTSCSRAPRCDSRCRNRDRTGGRSCGGSEWKVSAGDTRPARGRLRAALACAPRPPRRVAPGRIRPRARSPACPPHHCSARLTSSRVSRVTSSSSSVKPPSGSPASESKPAEISTRSGVNPARGVDPPPRAARRRRSLARQRRRQRHVPHVAVRPAIVGRAGARIPRPLVHRDEPDARVVLDQRLRAVAVMHVPVDDQHAIELLHPARVVRRDGDVAEQAESHRRVAQGRDGRAGARRRSCASSHPRARDPRRRARSRRPRSRRPTSPRSRRVSASSRPPPCSASARTLATYARSCASASSSSVACRPSR